MAHTMEYRKADGKVPAMVLQKDARMDFLSGNWKAAGTAVRRDSKKGKWLVIELDVWLDAGWAVSLAMHQVVQKVI
jgi:hypothetical protein